MEYVFGSRERHGVTQDILRTKGNKHTNLSGKIEIERKYDDCIITDSFNVLSKYQSKKDIEGNCYDWYVITGHYRYIDKYTPNIGKVEEGLNGSIIETQDAVCEATADLDQRITDIEDALCELSE